VAGRWPPEHRSVREELGVLLAFRMQNALEVEE